MSRAGPFDVAILVTGYKAQYESRHQYAQPATAHRYTDLLKHWFSRACTVFCVSSIFYK